MTIQEIAQIYKREWTQDIYGRNKLYQMEDGVEKYCFMGFFHYKIPSELATSVEGIFFLHEVGRRIKEKGYAYEVGNIIFQHIPSINDIEGGYEKLMGIIDDILLDAVKDDIGQKEKPAPVTVQAKELVYA
jgi:hypothetical protein